MSFVSGSNSAFSSSTFFLLVLVFDVQALLGRRLQLLSVELLQLLNGVFIDGVNHIQDFQPFLPQGLEEGTGGDGSNALASNVVDVVLALLHTIDILFQADLLVTRFRSVEPQELCHLGPVRGVLMDTQLDVLGELFIEFLVIILFFPLSPRTFPSISLPSFS